MCVFVEAAALAVALCGLFVLVVLAALGGPSPVLAHGADVAWSVGTIVLVLAVFVFLLVVVSAAVNLRP
jgi:hypothetical protein